MNVQRSTKWIAGWTISHVDSRNALVTPSEIRQRRLNRKRLAQYSRKNRKRSTSAERILWGRLRNKALGHTFYRQRQFGNYIADFYCPSASLVIEADGTFHVNRGNYDRERDEYLRSCGLTVIRVPNARIYTELDAVLLEIKRATDSISVVAR